MCNKRAYDCDLTPGGKGLMSDLNTEMSDAVVLNSRISGCKDVKEKTYIRYAFHHT